MANILLKHVLGYKNSVGNAGLVVADAADLLVPGCTAATGVCTDWSGNIFISDEEEHIIIKVTEGGQVSLFAGQAGVSGRANGVAHSATFNTPRGIACDRSGNLYVADTGNNQIRKINAHGTTSLLAGSPTGVAGLTNGANRAGALFDSPTDVTVDSSGWVYVADSGNNKIRVIRGANTYDLAGAYNGAAGDVIAQGGSARFSNPYGISQNRTGEVVVTDSGNKKIKVVRTDGTVSRVIGAAFHTGDNFYGMKYIEVDNSGFMYVVDYNDVTDLSRLIKLDQRGDGEIIVDFDVTKIGIAVSPNQTVYVTQSDAELESWSSSSSSNSSSSSSSFSSSSSSSSVS